MYLVKCYPYPSPCLHIFWYHHPYLCLSSHQLAFSDSTVTEESIQQAVLESETTLQSNKTTDLEKDDLATLLQFDDEIAEEQIDRLSLVTCYAGIGYILVRGNPEGRFQLWRN